MVLTIPDLPNLQRGVVPTCLAFAFFFFFKKKVRPRYARKLKTKRQDSHLSSLLPFSSCLVQKAQEHDLERSGKRRMHRQIGPLNLLAPLKLLKLAMIPHDRRTDIPCLPRSLVTTPRLLARIVARQGVAPAQMEAPSPPRTRRCRRHAGGAVVQASGLLGRDGAVSAHLARGDAEGFVAEDVRGEEVDDAEDEGEDAGADDDAPGGGAEGFLGRGGFVEVAEDGDAEDDHEGSESDEAGGGGEERPVGGDVGAEDGEFGYD